ncbi:TraV family lipoprotein [Pseudoduganella violacea]|uniref:Conjugal transfer pilus assembly protein TraV n=1 Tax=Pseudoduganella violacea TaxID=1715466 RepID=A0A7W5BFH4_9BURK|nr:TraV family lipoprotein [Pseudoduganella violacea]MBB3122174.1 conjugal transfer pilus assembly protein TraV [Pseudoduganella violacea]
MSHRPNLERPATLVATLVGSAMLGGCGNMSGLGGSAEYGCKAPAGVQCQSISGTYHQALRATQRLPYTSAPATHRLLLPTQGRDTAAGAVEAALPTPLRSAPRILRLWIKPWEDADHDLVDQSYVYVRIDEGRWQLDHVQRHLREAYAPLRAPVTPAPAAAVAPNPSPAPVPVAESPPAASMENGAAAPPPVEPVMAASAAEH